MINKIWITPPLAFARIGSSDTPVEAYEWGENDNNPKGSGKTVIVPATTLLIDENGKITESNPSEIKFKEIKGDNEIFHPVAPWYEVQCEYTLNGKKEIGNLTTELLKKFKIALNDITWEVHVENHKSYHMTLNEGDKIICKESFNYSDTTKKLLKGTSNSNSNQPLVPNGKFITLGAFQIANPNEEYPEIRVRFTPPKGQNYGPKDLKEKIQKFISTPGYVKEYNKIKDVWEELNIPTENLILNPDAAWCKYVLSKGDARTQPGELFAICQINNDRFSTGIIDDTSDGIITCSIKTKEGDLKAITRVVVCPQDFAPDRRHVVSIAENLIDRTNHLAIAEEYKNVSYEELSSEVQDIFERIFETMDFMNLDVINKKGAFQIKIPNTDPQQTKPPFNVVESVLPLPLTEIGRQHHRRFMSLEVLENIMRENIAREETGNPIDSPNEVKGILKMLNLPPLIDGSGTDENSHKKMPALMRGSDSQALHLTRRQYQLIEYWMQRLREKIKAELSNES